MKVENIIMTIHDDVQRGVFILNKTIFNFKITCVQFTGCCFKNIYRKNSTLYNFYYFYIKIFSFSIFDQIVNKE